MEREPNVEEIMEDDEQRIADSQAQYGRQLEMLRESSDRQLRMLRQRPVRGSERRARGSERRAREIEQMKAELDTLLRQLEGSQTAGGEPSTNRPETDSDEDLFKKPLPKRSRRPTTSSASTSLLPDSASQTPATNQSSSGSSDSSLPPSPSTTPPQSPIEHTLGKWGT